VPVEGEELAGEGERAVLRRRAVDGVPADLLVRAGVDAGAERTRDELRTQADAEHGATQRDDAGNETFLRAQPRQEVLVVDAHGAAERDQQVDIGRLGQRGVFEEARPGDAGVTRRQPGLNAAQPFERHVLEDVCAHGWASSQGLNSLVFTSRIGLRCLALLVQRTKPCSAAVAAKSA